MPHHLARGTRGGHRIVSARKDILLQGPGHPVAPHLPGLVLSAKSARAPRGSITAPRIPSGPFAGTEPRWFGGTTKRTRTRPRWRHRAAVRRAPEDRGGGGAVRGPRPRSLQNRPDSAHSETGTPPPPPALPGRLDRATAMPSLVRSKRIIFSR